jgi:hypothetical protein
MVFCTRQTEKTAHALYAEKSQAIAHPQAGSGASSAPVYDPAEGSQAPGEHASASGAQNRPGCVYGFRTGDLVRACVTKGKKMGTYRGRVAIKTDGYFKLTGQPFGMVEGIHARYCTPIHRKDGYVRRFGGYGIPVTNREG